MRTERATSVVALHSAWDLCGRCWVDLSVWHASCLVACAQSSKARKISPSDSVWDTERRTWHQSVRSLENTNRMLLMMVVRCSTCWQIELWRVCSQWRSLSTIAVVCVCVYICSTLIHINTHSSVPRLTCSSCRRRHKTLRVPHQPHTEVVSRWPCHHDDDVVARRIQHHI